MRADAQAEGAYRFGRFELNPAARQLLAEGLPVAVGARAFDVLLALIERRERLVTKDELLELAWPGLVVEENNLQVQISALRKLLGSQAIATVPGRGYRFTLALQDAGAPAAAQTPPAPDELDHRLTAILAADVAGYSKLMAADERATVAALDEVRAVFRKEIEANRGRVVDMAGDSVLALFKTATDALATAFAVQEALQTASASVPEVRRMRVRIGVHLGDVFVKPDGTVYGNGVNIAARLQAMARLGGICVSQTLYDTVKGKLALKAEPAGPQTFKNIAEPVPAWHVASGPADRPPALGSLRKRWLASGLAAVMVIASAAGAWWWSKREPAAGQAGAADAKSIAVLPFTNMSDDKANAYFADGVQEDLLTQLALLGELKVVSRTSVGEYRDTKKNLRQIGAELGVASLVEGSVRRAGERVRVTVQLIDARSDKHLWGQSYDRELKDIFAIQSELSTEIAKALKVSLAPSDQARLARRPTENLAAYELFLRQQELEGVATSVSADQGLRERVDLLSRAVELDPKFALAWARLAGLHARAHFWSIDRTDARLQKAQHAIDQALSLAPDDISVRSEAGNVYYYGYSDFERAAGYFENLLRTAPNHVETLTQLSWIRRRQGRWLEANALLERALAVDARNLNALATLTLNLFVFRHFDRALVLQRRVIDLQPGNLDAKALLHEIEYLKSGSYAGYEAWRGTLPPGVERASVFVWAIDINRAAARRDFDAVLRLFDVAPMESRFSWANFVDEGRALALLAKGERSRAMELARSSLRKSTLALEKDSAKTSSTLTRYRIVLDHAMLGEREAALLHLRRWIETERGLRKDVIEATDVADAEAIIYALLGERARALKLLREQAKRPTILVPNLWRIVLYYFPLWDDPEFQALVNDPATNAPLPIVNQDPALLLGRIGSGD